MDTERSLMFCELALRVGLIDGEQFAQVRGLCSANRAISLQDFVVELGWILPADVQPLNYLLDRKKERARSNKDANFAPGRHSPHRFSSEAETQGALTSSPASGSDSVNAVAIVPQQRQRYTLERLHATGGIGRVWVAHDAELGREIALKELRPERVGDRQVLGRFLREARITCQLEHPGIVPVYELALSPEDKKPFYTMRFVKGRTMSDAARTYHEKRAAGNSDFFEFLALVNGFVTICNTMAYAHSRGVVHRDLKGQNVLLGDFGEVVVADWGLAKLIGQTDAEGDMPIIGTDQDKLREGQLTLHGETIGTPSFMAPEQAAGQLDHIDYQTDVYGLGAILYEVLTGQPPFSGSNAGEVLRKVREQAPTPPSQSWPEVPSTLEAVCLRALAKKKTDRYSSASDLAMDVQRWQELQRRQAEEERNLFFLLSRDMLCVAGLDGYFKRVNPEFERVLGYTPEEMLAQPYLSFIHPEDQIATRVEAEAYLSGHETLFFENRYRRKDGTYIWMQWCSRHSPEQRLIYASARDITERKQVEKALRESEMRYRSVIAAMEDGIVILDSDGSVRTCNASAERILGLSAEQMTGRTSLDPRWRAIHEDGSPFPGETHPAWLTLQTGKPLYNVTMGVHKPSGELTWIKINSQPLFQADGVTLSGVVASFSDITSQKQTEEALKSKAVELERAYSVMASWGFKRGDEEESSP